MTTLKLRYPDAEETRKAEQDEAEPRIIPFPDVPWSVFKRARETGQRPDPCEVLRVMEIEIERAQRGLDALRDDLDSLPFPCIGNDDDDMPPAA